MYTSLRMLGGDFSTPRELKTTYNRGNAMVVSVSLPPIFVMDNACLRFAAYLEKNPRTGLLVNTSSGVEWWIPPGAPRTWKEASTHDPSMFMLHWLS